MSAPALHFKYSRAEVWRSGPRSDNCTYRAAWCEKLLQCSARAGWYDKNISILENIPIMNGVYHAIYVGLLTVLTAGSVALEFLLNETI